MYRTIVEMGGNFTGVKNEILTRLAAVLAAVAVVLAAADLALVQPPDLAAQLVEESKAAPPLCSAAALQIKSPAVLSA